MNRFRRHLLAALATAACCAGAQADTWPSKPITWVVPFAPVGSADKAAGVIGVTASSCAPTSRAWARW